MASTKLGTPSLQMKGRSPKPPGSRTENLNKQRLSQAFGKMTGMMQPKIPKGKTKLK